MVYKDDQGIIYLNEWNRLPENVIAADPVESFKKHLEKHMNWKR